MASPPDVEDVKATILELSNNPLPVSVQSDLQDEEKRWLVVGICLHSIISPVLRTFIDPVMKKLYKKLKKSHSIDTQTHPNILVEYPQQPQPKRYKLNYESINNNRQHGKKGQKFFDYKVKDAVDLSKLFILPHMAHYSGFDESCDSSVLLGLIINIEHKFQPPLKIAADKVRKEIRNIWAHCDFRVWDQMKFMQCFQIMTQLVKDLQLSPQEEMDALGQLTQWQCTGQQLLSGTTIGLDLLKNIKTGEAALAKYLLHVSAFAEKTDSDLHKAHEELAIIDTSLSLTMTRIKKLEKSQGRLEADLSSLCKEHGDLETTVETQNEKLSDIASGLNEVERNVESIKNECDASKLGLTKRVDMLTERVSHIEHYNSSNKPDKIFFYTPDRIGCFVGRTEELTQLERKLCTNDNSAIHFVSGLGGSGKTSFAIEFSWSMQNYYQGGLFWISGEKMVSFIEDVARIAHAAETVGKDSQETLILTLEWLSKLPSKWLLVVDNVDDEDLSKSMKELLFGAWKRKSQGHILVTTRREPIEIEETFKAEPEHCIVLGPMTATESINFILKRTKQLVNDEHLEYLVEELHGLPLAMEQATSYIKILGCSFKEYLVTFQKKRLKLYQRPITTKYGVSKERLTVRTTWHLNFDYICKESEDEGLGNSVPFVMNIAAFFFGDDIPEELFNTGEPKIDNDDLKDVMEDPAGVKQVIAILTRFSLFQRCRAGSLQVHRLVQEVIRDNITDMKDKIDVLQGAIKMLNSALNSTKSPKDVLGVQASIDTLRGHLCLWRRLGMTSCSLRNHINLFVKEHGPHKELLQRHEMLKVFQTSAVFHSVFQNQAEALSAQTEMLHFMSIYDSSISDKQKRELTSITIPIKTEERKLLQISIEQSTIENDLKDSAIVDPDKLRKMGNKAFRENREHDAIHLYTEGIKCSRLGEVDIRLYVKCSLCYLRVSDFERALEDANHCIAKDAFNWKAHCWRAKAIASLIQNGTRSKTLEATGLASANIACYLNPKVKEDLKIKMLYPILNPHLVTNPSHFERCLSASQPGMTLLLKKGRYKISPFPAANHVQVIGIENEVEIFFHNVLQIFPSNQNVSEDEIQVHFENLSFVKGAGQIIATSGTTLIFYRCKFSNSSEACDNYPYCKGGQGCKNPDPTGCELQFEQFNTSRGTGFFCTGVSGSPAVCAFDGGHIMLESCILDGCGGGGALSDGKGSVLKAAKCTIINNHQSGLEARKGGELIATDNVIQNNHHHGILIGPYGIGYVQTNVISGNTCEGILCGETETGPDGELKLVPPGYKNTAVIEDNVLSHNGLCGISLDGGTYLINKNKIFDNWCWGMMAKTRASCHITNNDIFSNICGGIRIGFNYSATVYLDANTIQDHTGPHLFTLQFPVKMKPISKRAQNTELVRSSLTSSEIPDDEVTQYTSSPIITTRNVFRHNDMRFQHPSEKLVVPNVCAFCHKNGKNMKTCGHCGKAFYCNQQCQVSHWIRHKHFCKMFKEKFTVSVEMKNTRPFGNKKPGEISFRILHPSLKGTGKGPKPDRNSSKRFIVKIQSGLEYTHYDPQTYLLLYDKSVDVDFEFQNPELYHLIMECGILAGNTFTTKKIFCWASFKEKGNILKVYTDNLPPFQTW